MCVYVARQVRKPDRWAGRLFLKRMNDQHSPLTDWGLQYVRIEPRFEILDVGCGGGRTLEKLATLAPEGHVCGVDFAAGSIVESQRRNAKRIDAGRVEVRHASVDHLPYPEGRFDLVTAIETHYYWPDLVGGLREIRRVLRPGGTLLVVAELHRDGPLGGLYRIVMAPLSGAVLSAREHVEAFERAGYADVEVRTHGHGWISVWGTVPPGAPTP